jgi:two-component system, OmpR family, KDP operon response regulator KdpE
MTDAQRRQAIPATVLVVEDEPRLVRLIRAILESDGYRVDVVHDGESALERIALAPPDLVLLDLLLPGSLDGYAICERIRGFSMTPVIMLTARVQEDDKLRGFDAGADDYITKPFSARELLARVHAVLRRSRTQDTTPAIVDVGSISINFAAQEVTSGGESVHLTPTEFKLLVALARHPGRAMTHTALLTEVWGAEYRDEIDYLRTYIRYLRRKLEPDPASPRYLITVPGTGYRLEPD